MARSARPVAARRRPAPRRARLRRLWSLGVAWIFMVFWVLNALVLGEAFFWFPAVVFGAGAVVTTRLALSPEAPERAALEPGELEAATKAAPVEVDARWTPGGETRARAAERGTLRFDGRRLSFVTDKGVVGFDAPVNKLRLITVPGFWRPQLDVEIAERVHTVHFVALWDLGATVVGPVVAGEWYHQLRDLGAH